MVLESGTKGQGSSRWGPTSYMMVYSNPKVKGARDHFGTTRATNPAHLGYLLHLPNVMPPNVTSSGTHNISTTAGAQVLCPRKPSSYLGCFWFQVFGLYTPQVGPVVVCENTFRSAEGRRVFMMFALQLAHGFIRLSAFLGASEQLWEGRSQLKLGLGLGPCKPLTIHGLVSAEKYLAYHMDPARMGYGSDKDLTVASYCSGCGQNVTNCPWY